MAPQTILVLVRYAGCDGARYDLIGMRQIVGMEEIRPDRPIPDLLQRRSQILEGSLIDKLDFARRAHSGDKSGNAVDNLPKFTF